MAVVSLKIFAISLLTFAVSYTQVRAQSSEMKQALEYESLHNYAQAEAAFSSLTEATPGDAQAWAHLGLDRALQGKYDDAAPAYRRALKLDPKLPGLQIDLGLALFKQAQFREAIPALLAASEEAPHDDRPKILLGMSYYGAAEFSQAIPYLKLAVNTSPQNLEIRTTLAHSCLWAKQYACALEQYKSIVQQSPDSPEADMIAGEALDGQGNTTGAITQFRAAAKASPNLPNVHFGLGYLLWKLNQIDEAGHEFGLELALDPNNEQALTYLGDVAIKKNDNGTARRYLQRAIEQKSPIRLTYLDMGILNAQAGQNTEAEVNFKHAIVMDPDDPEAHWRLGRLFQTMGDKQQADMELAKVKLLHQRTDRKDQALAGMMTRPIGVKQQ
jgi:tetratricopeptide (TPR) repeat protein